MERLSHPLSRLAPRYDVVVVGSGYGGSVAASRFARAGRSVCLLERGREFFPGEFPDRPDEALAQFQIHSSLGRGGSSDALYNLCLGEDISVLTGCGLGGGSLINAAVALAPEPEVFARGWPAALAGDSDGALAVAYERARSMLGVSPLPGDLTPAKLTALEESAAALSAGCRRVPLAIDFESCTQCGDCVAGCNTGAKRSTTQNYLPDAVAWGAALFTGTSVSHLTREAGGWRVHFTLTGGERERFGAPLPSVEAELVVLAAGTLGSSEILMRSANDGLPLSRRLGERFSGNGDVIAYAYNADRPINGVGQGGAVGDAAPGPCITGVIRLPAQQGRSALTVQDGALPSAMAPALPAAFAAAAGLLGEDTDTGIVDTGRERLREWNGLFGDPKFGAPQHTQTFLVMGHDDAGGRLSLIGDTVTVDWPGVGRQPLFAQVDEVLRTASAALGATYVHNPLWSRWLGRRLITVHPLGGCAMGEDAGQGVVDHIGQVFDGRGGLHPGLYVMDGAVIPRALGVNPLLTITALAERACAKVAEQRGWSIDYDAPGSAGHLRPLLPVLRFTETMRGHVAGDPGLGSSAAETHGAENGDEIAFTLTLEAEPADRLFVPGGEATVFGTVSIPCLSGEPLTVVDGRFRLFGALPGEAAARHMTYHLPLAARGGRRFLLTGRKILHDEPGFDLWADTTTLYADVADADGHPRLRGILRISAPDLLRQLGTLQVSGVARERGKAIRARFARYFAGTLLDLYLKPT